MLLVSFQVYNNAIQCLSEEDRELPAIGKMLPMLQRGIGVHHSGLLPILKELIEILFQEQLIKVGAVVQVLGEVRALGAFFLMCRGSHRDPVVGAAC